jgi:hopanoid-associated phosphorylase
MYRQGSPRTLRERLALRRQDAFAALRSRAAARGWIPDIQQSLLTDTDFSMLAMVGLSFEARIAAGPGVLVVCRAACPDYPMLLQRAAKAGCRCMLSFGVAGGLSPELRPGDCIVASSVIDGERPYATDAHWSDRLVEMAPGIRRGDIVGVDAVVQEPSAKRKLGLRTGAVAVDMESHLVARAAREQDLAFAVVRVIIDPAERTVPDAALFALKLRGSAYLTALVSELAARPSELLGLLRIAIDSYAARSSLLRIRRALGPQFGFAIDEDAAERAPSESVL